MHRLRRTKPSCSCRCAPLVVSLAAALALILPASAFAAYGAIAINPQTAQSGVSYNYVTKAHAKKRARNECPDKCKIAIWIRSQCGAVVRTDQAFYAASGRSKRKAYKHASHRAHGHSLRVAYVCSG